MSKFIKKAAILLVALLIVSCGVMAVAAEVETDAVGTEAADVSAAPAEEAEEADAFDLDYTDYDVAKDYPEIEVDDYYVDITAANLIKEPQNSKFNVFVLPNLYGDIITDEAAQIQGGVGTAGSANIGGRYAMFEAIHGSAPRMIKEGRGAYANPSSIVKASCMMLRHMGFADKACILESALEKAGEVLNMTSDDNGNTTDDFTKFMIEQL